jgi:hypothetical protein
MEMARDQPGSPQDRIRRPSMTVEDPDAAVHHPARRMNENFPREVPDDPHVVIAENQLDGEVFAQELGKEVEDDGA